MTRAKKLTVLIVVLTIITGSLIRSAMSYPKKATEKSRPLRVALNADISTLHLASSSKGSKIHASHAIRLLFEGLMKLGKGDVIEPAVAKSVEVSPNKKTYTFHLRDCFWSDGEPVKAEDFEYAWKQCMNPRSKSITISPFYYSSIKNAKRYILEECSEEDLGIHCPDNKTLIVELERPAAYFLDLTTSSLFYPVPKHQAETDPKWAESQELVCNGPFSLKSRKQNSELIFAKNPSYRDAENVRLEEIHFYIIPDGNTALNMFRKGEIDWVGSPFSRLSYDISDNVKMTGDPDSIACWISVNVEKYPLNNKKLRQALSYAVNREAIVENVFHHTGSPSTCLLPECMRLQNNTEYFQDNNPELAQKYLAEALDELGITKEQLPPIEFQYTADIEFLKRMVQALQNQWRQVLGIKTIQLKPTEKNILSSVALNGEYQMLISSMTTFVFDPIFFFNAFKEKSDNLNATRWEHPDFKQLFDESEHALGEIERSRILIQAEKLLMKEMPIIPICSIHKQYAKNPKLKGEQVSNLPAVDFTYAYFED